MRCRGLGDFGTRPGPGGTFFPPDPGRRPVTVKDQVGRPRYLAFRLEGGPLPRPVLSGALPPAAKLTRYDGTHGIVRTLHRDRDAIQTALESLARIGNRGVRVVTLATSGTMRKAAEALPRESAAAKREGRKEREKKPAGAARRPPAAASPRAEAPGRPPLDPQDSTGSGGSRQ